MTTKISLQRARKRYCTLLLGTMLALGLSACSQNQTRLNQRGLEASKPISIKYEVQRGDNLSKIAQQLTGDRENWAEIASINAITEPKKLQVGMILSIPDYLLPELAETKSTTFKPAKSVVEEAIEPAEPETVETPVIVAAKAEEPQPVEPAKKSASKKKRSRKDWIFQASSLPGRLEIPAVVHRAATNRTFVIERTEPGDVDNSNAVTTAETDAQSTVGGTSVVVDSRLVRVVGTYYPKGIYSQPSYNSTLLMRVAPGTQLELEQSFDEWLQVRTDKGSGYIRKIDADIIGSASSGALVLNNNG